MAAPVLTQLNRVRLCVQHYLKFIHTV